MPPVPRPLIAVALPVLTMLVVATPAVAAGPGAQVVTLGAGSAVPTGEFADVADTGWLVGASLAIHAAPRLALGLDLAIHEYASDLEAADVSLFRATAQATYVLGPMRARVTPYLKGSLGFYFPNLSTEFDLPGFSDEEFTDTETEFGVGAGAGVAVRLDDRWSGFVEGAYHLADKVEYGALRAGLMATWGTLGR
jgi:hypothetical protein